MVVPLLNPNYFIGRNVCIQPTNSSVPTGRSVSAGLHVSFPFSILFLYSTRRCRTGSKIFLNFEVTHALCIYRCDASNCAHTRILKFCFLFSNSLPNPIEFQLHPPQCYLGNNIGGAWWASIFTKMTSFGHSIAIWERQSDVFFFLHLLRVALELSCACNECWTVMAMLKELARFTSAAVFPWGLSSKIFILYLDPVYFYLSFIWKDSVSWRSPVQTAFGSWVVSHPGSSRFRWFSSALFCRMRTLMGV